MAKQETKQAEEFPIEELKSATQGWEKKALERIKAKKEPEIDEVNKALDILINL